MNTWRDYAHQLTLEQIADLELCDLRPSHPNGPEGHRLGQIAVAQLYVQQRPWWRRW